MAAKVAASVVTTAAVCFSAETFCCFAGFEALDSFDDPAISVCFTGLTASLAFSAFTGLAALEGSSSFFGFTVFDTSVFCIFSALAGFSGSTGFTTLIGLTDLFDFTAFIGLPDLICCADLATCTTGLSDLDTGLAVLVAGLADLTGLDAFAGFSSFGVLTGLTGDFLATARDCTAGFAAVFAAVFNGVLLFDLTAASSALTAFTGLLATGFCETGCLADPPVPLPAAFAATAGCVFFVAGG